MAKGEIPIEKNVRVVDEQGNEYEATWPRRAKGLVKNGRARFLSENTICLACPPNQYLEDDKMLDKIMYQEDIDDDSKNIVKSPCMGNGGQEEAQNQQMDVFYIMNQINKVLEQTDYLHEAIASLSKMSDGECGEPYSAGNIMGQAKANAFKDIVCYRETTNQQVLRMYEKMYDDVCGRH